MRRYTIAWYKHQLKDAHDATAHEAQRRKDADSAKEMLKYAVRDSERAYNALEEQAGREICDLRQQALDLSNEVIRVKAAAFDLVTKIKEAQ